MNIYKFLRDSGSNYVIYALQLGIGIIAVPIYLNTYGDDLYGVYLLSIGLASSVTFLQFGSGQAILRYAAEYVHDREEDKYGLALNTCMVLSGGSSVVALVIFIGLAVYRDSIFTIPVLYLDEAFWLLLVAGVYAFLLFWAQLPQSMLKGAGVFYQRNKLMLLELLVRGGLVGLVFWQSIGIYWLLAGETFLLLVSLFFDFYLLRRLQHVNLLRSDLVDLRITPKLFSGEIWNYAKDTFFLSVVSFFSQSSDRLLIALFLDVRFVTVYNVITKPFNVLKSLLSKAFVVLNPYYIEILKTSGKERLNEFIALGTKILVSAMLIPVLLLAAFLPGVLAFWLGTNEYADYAIYGQLLLLVLVVKSVTSLYNNALYTIGAADKLLKVSLLSVGINLVFGLSFIGTIGVGAVILGTCLQLTLVGPLLINIADRYFQSSNSGLYLWHIGMVFICAALAALYYIVGANTLMSHFHLVLIALAAVLSVVVAVLFSQLREMKTKAFFT